MNTNDVGTTTTATTTTATTTTTNKGTFTHLGIPVDTYTHTIVTSYTTELVRLGKI